MSIFTRFALFLLKFGVFNALFHYDKALTADEP